MKLFLYDKFMDSFIRLPKGIQKKTMDFMEKFKRDPKSHAINLEKIVAFKDPQLRTARIDQTYRAIVHVSKTDDVFHLLWADHHDEAMAWATNKFFEWNQNTQSYQVFELEDLGVLQKDVAPIIAQDGIFAGYTDTELEKLGVPAVLLPSVRKIEDLNGLQAIERYLPVDAFENLFYLTDGLSLEEILKDIEDGKIIEPQSTDTKVSFNNQRFFFEITDKDLQDIFKDDFQKWKIFLHPSQRKVVTSTYKGAVKITGLAGTGKTVCALHRVKTLLSYNIASQSKPILFTTFTKSLIASHKESLALLGVNNSKVAIDNIHGFAIDNAKQLGIIPKSAKILDFSDDQLKLGIWEDILETIPTRYSADFLKEEFSEIVVLNNIKLQEEYLRIPRVGRSQKLGRKDRIEIWSIFEKYLLEKQNTGYFELGEMVNKLADYYEQSGIKPFSFIIADEIQDFSGPELRLLRSMVAEGENDLFLVGDPLQKIYLRKINFSRVGINVRGNRSKQLRVNYRTTEEIKRLAVATVNDQNYEDFDGELERKNGYISLTHGDKPVYELLGNLTEELVFVKAKIDVLVTEKSNVLFKDICIATRLKSTLSEVKKYLHHNKIPYYDITSGTGNPDGVSLSTFHSIKGLEFKIVFMVDVNSKTMPLRPSAFDIWDKSHQAEFDNKEKSLLYVAMTRAIQLLYITGSGKKSDWVKI